MEHWTLLVIHCLVFSLKDTPEIVTVTVDLLPMGKTAPCYTFVSSKKENWCYIVNCLHSDDIMVSDDMTCLTIHKTN